ncbi:MAG: polysaccharide biosynthesis tyrosine autokinase [Coriobacteriia bacterium]
MELRDYLNVISARRWVIIQAVVVVTLTAVVMSLVQPKVYQGEAKVLISEKDTGAALLGTSISEFSGQPERGLQTQVQLMQLRPLAENVVRRLGLEMSPEGLLRRVVVAANGQTNVISVRATADDPDEAAAIANGLADEYVVWSRETRRESIKTAADEVEERITQAEKEVLELGSKVSAEGKSDELTAELALLTTTYSTLADRLEQLRINEQLEVGLGRVVSPAVANGQAIAPKLRRNAMLGAIAGLMLGLGMAFLYDYLDNTIKSNEDAERLFAVPVLGTIPFDKKPENAARRRLAIVEDSGSAVAEAYRVLRNSLDFINFEHKLKTLLVTSAAPAEGKSTVTANLAASLAQAGKKVVLVSSDFRRPMTEQFFGVSNVIGLSDVLLGTHSLKAALQRPTDEQLLILTSGKMPPNPSELLGSAKMQSLVGELEEWADWVIIDTPPLLAVADPASVARWADGVLMVIHAGKSTHEASTKAVELLDKVGAQMVGVVAWGLDSSKSSGYSYYTGGHYYFASYGQFSSQVPGGDSMSALSAAGRSAAWETPELSAGRGFARALGKVSGAFLAFSAVLAIVSAVVYALDQYMGWGLAASLFGLF